MGKNTRPAVDELRVDRVDVVGTKDLHPVIQVEYVRGSRL